MTCPRCNSTDIAISTYQETKKAGCFTMLFYILLALTILGLLIVIPLMLRGKGNLVTMCVCRTCGYRWKLRYK